MPRLNCDCGHSIGTGSFPNRDVHFLWSEDAYDSIEQPIELHALERIFARSPKVVRCQNCHSLYVNWRNGDGFVKYTPQSS